jgi:DNA-binding HxlR family transcriptional regulator
VSGSPEPHSPVDAETCERSDAALVRAFDLLGKRWTGVVLGTLSRGPTGFRALGRAVEGISDSMLSDRLAALCTARLVTRCVDGGPPLSVTYALTDAGRALLPALEQISRWAETHLPSADQAHPAPTEPITAPRAAPANTPSTRADQQRHAARAAPATAETRRTRR